MDFIDSLLDFIDKDILSIDDDFLNPKTRALNNVSPIQTSKLRCRKCSNINVKSIYIPKYTTTLRHHHKFCEMLYFLDTYKYGSYIQSMNNWRLYSIKKKMMLVGLEKHFQTSRAHILEIKLNFLRYQMELISKYRKKIIKIRNCAILKHFSDYDICNEKDLVIEEAPIKYKFWSWF